MLDSVVFYKSHISERRGVFHNFMRRRCENKIVAWVFTFFMGSTITGKRGGGCRQQIFIVLFVFLICLLSMKITITDYRENELGWSYRVTFRPKNPFGAFLKNILWIFCQIQDETQLHPQRLFHVFFQFHMKRTYKKNLSSLV